MCAILLFILEERKKQSRKNLTSKNSKINCINHGSKSPFGKKTTTKILFRNKLLKFQGLMPFGEFIINRDSKMLQIQSEIQTQQVILVSVSPVASGLSNRERYLYNTRLIELIKRDCI